jgi:predicted transcriptional regulator
MRRGFWDTWKFISDRSRKARFRAAVREGVARADRGEFIEEEEMDARFAQMPRS